MAIKWVGTVTPGELQAHYADAGAECRRITDALGHGQFNWKKSEERWSIGQCIDHLNASGELVAERLVAAMDGTSPPWLATVMTPFETAFVWSMTPRVPVRVPSPGAYRPTSSEIDLEEAVDRFDRLQAHLKSVLQDYLVRDNLHRFVQSPASRFLWMSARAWFELTAVHQQRHLNQALRVLEDRHFPDSA